ESWTRSDRRSERSGHANDSQNAAGTLRYNRSTYPRPIVRCSNPLDNASIARILARFPESCPRADTRESAEELCRPIARQSCPKVVTIPRRPLSSRTSFLEWLGPESNRRHADFQSAALPTELPSRDDADRGAVGCSLCRNLTVRQGHAGLYNDGIFKS